MLNFEYLAINNNGAKVNGKINARSQDSAIKALQARSLYPVEIKQIGGSSEEKGLLNRDIKLPFLKKGVSKAEIAEFSRQFGTLIETGIPYHKALEIITPSNQKSKLSSIISSVKLKVLEGSSLYKAMSEYKDVFSTHYLASIQAGERTGKLGANMLQQAGFIDSQQEIKGKLQSALIYPAIMMILGIGILIFMVQFILPKIVPIFASFNKALPLPTRILMGISNFLNSFGWVLLLLIIGGIVYFRRYIKTTVGRKKVEALLLKLPIVGPELKQIQLLRFSISLSTLLNSGITVKEALPIAGDASGSFIFADEVKKISEQTVSKGLSLSAALKRSYFFDESYVQIIKVGEESGQLDSMVAKLGENLKSDTDSRLRKFVALLEPLIIVFMALMVGAIVMAILLPIFEINLLIQ